MIVSWRLCCRENRFMITRIALIRFWAIIRYENQFWSGMIKTAAEGYTDDCQKQAMIFSRGAGRDSGRINGEYLCAAIFFKQLQESFLTHPYIQLPVVDPPGERSTHLWLIKSQPLGALLDGVCDYYFWSGG